MEFQGTFGYIIGKTKRMMYIEKNADLLWQILVREIYVLLQHYKTKEALQEIFQQIKITKKNPKDEDREKYKIFTKLDISNQKNIPDDWQTILYYCQCSFINILESGYINNQLKEIGLTFLLDFNKGSVQYYKKDLNGKIQKISSATLDEIMKFEDMPTKSYTEIITEMKNNFNVFYDKYLKVNEELNNLNRLKENAKKQGAINIENKVDKLIYDMNWEMKKLHLDRRVFYYRLQALNLIEDTLVLENI